MLQVLNETRSTVTAFNDTLREMTDRLVFFNKGFRVSLRGLGFCCEGLRETTYRRPPLVFLHGVYEELLTAR